MGKGTFFALLTVLLRKADPVEEKGPPACRNLWVGNVHQETTEEEIAEAFRPFGTIERIRVVPHKSCAFVNFATLEACITAKNKMQGKTLHGQQIKLNFGKVHLLLFLL